jgi:glycosyltransferase involved in cell wall biosynthesis
VRGKGPRIVIDARPLSHPQAGGFRTYVRALVRGLKERAEAGEDNDEEFILYLDRPLPPEAETTLPPGVQTRVLSPERLKTDLRLFRAQVKADAPDLVHGTMNYLPPLPGGVPSTVTLHDAMGIKRYPWDAATPRTPRERFINRYWAFQTRSSAQRARRIVTVSRGAADEIAGALRLSPSCIRVVYNGVYLPPPLDTGAARQTGTVLAIESPDPRKNLTLLFRALSEHRSRFGVDLPRLGIVCTSERSIERVRSMVARFPLGGGVAMVRDVDDETLSTVYANSTVFAWPSRLEGFGLPPLEAMRNGCPVVSSSAPVMPEVLGDAPLYADPDRPDEFADRLARLLSDPAEREARGRLGQAHAATYTCRKMADGTAAVWWEALS